MAVAGPPTLTFHQSRALALAAVPMSREVASALDESLLSVSGQMRKGPDVDWPKSYEMIM